MKSLLLNTIQGCNTNFCSADAKQKSFGTKNSTPNWPKEFSQIKTYNLSEGISKPELQTSINYPKNNQTNNTNEHNNTDITAKAAGTAVLLRGAQACIEKLSQFFAQMLMRGKEFAKPSDVENVAKHMKADNKLEAEICFIDNTNKNALKKLFPGLSKELDTVANGANAFYTNTGNFAVAPKSKPSLILHELGHAINFEKSKVFKGLQKLRVAGMYAPTALVFLNNISGKQKDGKESFIERHAGLIGFCSFLPTIIEEGAASYRGIKAAKKVLPNVKLGALKKNYFFAWMTYVLAGVGVGIASKLMLTEKKLQNGGK